MRLNTIRPIDPGFYFLHYIVTRLVKKRRCYFRSFVVIVEFLSGLLKV